MFSCFLKSLVRAIVFALCISGLFRIAVLAQEISLRNSSTMTKPAVQAIASAQIHQSFRVSQPLEHQPNKNGVDLSSPQISYYDCDTASPDKCALIIYEIQ